MILADFIDTREIGLAGEARAVVAVTLRISAGRLFERQLHSLVVHLARRAGLDGVVGAVHRIEHRRNPGAAGLGQDMFELRELLVHAAHHEVPVAGLTVEGHVLDPDRFCHRALAVLRQALAGMLIDDQTMVLDGSIYPVPRRVVERLQPCGVGRDERQENAAAQP